MRRASLALLLLAPLLGGCTRTADTFKPRIVITSPDGGGVGRARSFTVKGYALDDQGITGLTVNGQPVPIQPGSRKIARFEFQTQIQGGRSEYTVGARDAAGNQGTLVLPVAVDIKPPVVKVTRFEQERDLVRVTGIATDDTRVTEVSVDGKRLNIAPGAQVDFYAETSGTFADIAVTDGAGNVTKLRAQR